MKAISNSISGTISGVGGRKQQNLISSTTTTTMMDSMINENYDYHNKFGHSFIIRTFITPIKCYVCTSLMIGLVRQGYVCEGLFLFIFLMEIFLIFGFLL